MHWIFTATRALLRMLLAGLALTSQAVASAPALVTVDHDGLHPAATFTAPDAGGATVYIATRPDRATDGNFLTENSAGLDVLTDVEIASGVWLSEERLSPGTYYVMLKASTYDCPGGADCADGFSDVMTLVVPKPKQRFTTRKKSGLLGALTLTITPTGEDVPYKLCWNRGHGRLCKHSKVIGYDWTRSGSDTIYLSVDDLKLPKNQTKLTFTWYVHGKRVGSRSATIGPV